MKKILVVITIASATAAFAETPSTASLGGSAILTKTNDIPDVKIQTRADGSLIITGKAPAPGSQGKSVAAKAAAEPVVTPCLVN